MREKPIDIPRSFQLCQGILLLLLTAGALHALDPSTMETAGVLAAAVAAASLTQRPSGGATLGAVAAAGLLASATADDTHPLLWSNVGYGLVLLAFGFLTPHLLTRARDNTRRTTAPSNPDSSGRDADDDRG